MADPSTVVDMTGAKPVLLRPGKVCEKAPLSAHFLGRKAPHRLPLFASERATEMSQLDVRSQGIVEDWMLMEAHDSSELQEVGGLKNPYA